MYLCRDQGYSMEKLSKNGRRDARKAQAHLARFLVDRRLSDELACELPLEPKIARLRGGERPAKATAKLLQVVVIGLAELLDGYLGVADLGDGRASEAAKDIADAPDRERHDEAPDDQAHDRLAEHTGRRFTQTSKHGRS